MRKFPTVLNLIKEDNKVILELLLDKDLAYFAGHFPGRPILPGVAQLDLVIRSAKQYLTDFKIVNISIAKFTKILVPDTKVSLSISINKSQLIYKLYDTDGLYASGKINIEELDS